jgi:saccharopine dehydrogenase-like NADP-dependent oxidoreductase
LECLPNRNSLLYETKYGIPEVEKLFRGTLRYGGFSGIMSVFQCMGLLHAEDAGGVTWSDVIYNLQRQAGMHSFDNFLLYCADGDPENAARAANCFDFLGMGGDAPIAYPDNLVASFCETLASKCKYEEGERDMVLMHTSIQASFTDGSNEEHRSSLQAYGDAKFSAMSKTVGCTAAAATEVLLKNKSSLTTGLLLPTTKELYLPILEAMEAEGVKFKEDVRIGDAKDIRSVHV